MLPWMFFFGVARAEEPRPALPEPAAEVGPSTPEQAVAFADERVAAGEVDQALAQIQDGDGSTRNFVGDIAWAAAEQRSASQDIAKHVERIARMAEDSSRAIEVATDAARDLETLATAVNSQVSQFRA
jgi:methyl-accepting chemotaxis protein